MLHFFSGIERSEEEKGDGAFCVFAEIRQIDQFPHVPPTRRTAPGLSGLSGRGRSPFRQIKKAAEDCSPAAALACLIFQKELTNYKYNAVAKEFKALIRRCAQGLSPSLIFSTPSPLALFLLRPFWARLVFGKW